MANQPNDAVEKLRLGAWLPFGGDASEAQDGVAWPREAKELRDALVAFGEEAAAAAVRLVEACAARGGWAAPATGCRATLTINGYGFAGAPGVSPETCPEATTIDHQSPENKKRHARGRTYGRRRADARDLRRRRVRPPRVRV